MRALLLDAPLFTGPYDAALSAGLRAAGVEPLWAARRARAGEEREIAPRDIALDCYRLTDGPRRRDGRAWQLAKGIEHGADLRRIMRLADRRAVDVVHVQWAPIPTLDRLALRRIGRTRAVVMTVHDVDPFNGRRVSAAQVSGFDALLRGVDHLIVHTRGGREALIARGVARERVSVIAHGPLALRATASAAAAKPRDRWRYVLFGRIQDYKGVDVLVEALGRLEPATRARIEVVVAGKPTIALEPLRARAAALGVTGRDLVFRSDWLSDQETADLLAGADAFVFPYRAIEASGVLFLVAGLGKWMVASALGAFIDTIGRDGTRGALLAPGDADALASALVDGIGRRPGIPATPATGWDEIGRETADLYRRLISAREHRTTVPSWG